MKAQEKGRPPIVTRGVCEAKTEGKHKTMKRKIEIAFETKQTIVWRRRSETVETWCESCAAPSLMLDAQHAAFGAGLSLRQICQQVETGNLHFIETEEGLLLICLTSLSNKTNCLEIEQG
jgi:hypothetical protein